MSDSTEEIDGFDDTSAVASLEAIPVIGSTPSVGGGPDPNLSIPELLPILPVRDIVVFPGTVVPITVGREKSKRLIEEVFETSKVVGVVAQRNAAIEDPGLDEMYRVGTAVAILKVLPLGEGKFSIIAHGLVRFGIEEFIRTEPYIIARTHTREDAYERTAELAALVETARSQAAKVIEMTPGVPDDAVLILNNIEKPNSLADFLAANLSLKLIEKQELLETFNISARLKKINQALANQIEILELSRKIQNQVRSEVDKTQREYYLQQQLRAIQKELGETDGRDAELAELERALDEAKLPPEVDKEARRELERARRMSQASPEYSGSLDYLHWMAELPWSISTEDNLDLTRAEQTLNNDHHGLEKVKKRILEFLAVRSLKREGRGPILCFVGPPGVGKTSLGQSIARALGRAFIRMSVGGVRDEADIRGHRRTYVGALPGRIIQEIRKAGANNPVFMIDEVDKIGADFRGDPSSALLEVLDPEQNATFQDHFLGVPFDLSRVMFICTANYLEAVPPPLRDRMEVIELPGYTRLEKLAIAKRYLLPRSMERNGLEKKQLRFADEALEAIIDNYTAEAGVRNLEREIAGVCRGVATQVARGESALSLVTPRHLEQFLGPIKFEPELALRTSVPGVATGLAWTPAGGDIMFVEATAMPGKGQLQYTGYLGDVMKESVQAAYSVLRAGAKRYGIDPKRLGEHDLHIHVPSGAIPKDGPSAGVAMFTAMASLYMERACRSDTAMTGEITLRGLVLPIGGLKEKSLAAHRGGIKRVLIPSRNEKDLVEVPAEVRKDIKFVPCKTVDEVLKAALESPARPKGAASKAKSKTRRRRRSA